MYCVYNMKKIEIKKQQIKLSRRQEELADLYMEAKGKVVFWTKENRTMVLNPDEVVVVEGRIS